MEPGHGRRHHAEGHRGVAGLAGRRRRSGGVRRRDDGALARPRPAAGHGDPGSGGVPRAPLLGRRRAHRRFHLRDRHRRAGACRPVSARSPRVLIIGEFGAGALGLYYARAFETLGWAPTCYDMWAGYTRGGVLAGSRVLRRLLRPALWALMAREAIALAGR